MVFDTIIFGTIGQLFTVSPFSCLVLCVFRGGDKRRCEKSDGPVKFLTLRTFSSWLLLVDLLDRF